VALLLVSTGELAAADLLPKLSARTRVLLACARPARSGPVRPGPGQRS
jgi:hypothetical protein